MSGLGWFGFKLGLLVVLLARQQLCGTQAQGVNRELPQYEVVHPTRVDVRGHFLSNFLSHHARRVQRREAKEDPVNLDQVFYQLQHGSRNLHFNLTLNPHLLAPGFLIERRFGGLDGAKLKSPESSQCYFLGEVRDERAARGSAAISTCDGLTGLFKLADEEFFIQPLERSNPESPAPQRHAVYKRHAPQPSWSPAVQLITGEQVLNGSCGVSYSHQSLEVTERQRERWERRRHRRRRIHQRSVSKEKWVETLVVADPKMVEYHGSKAVESYVLAVMNIVTGLFKDPTIGNAINIVVVRLILLEQDEDELKITHHADNSLNSFCKWQKQLNMKGDDHPLHHDVAVLLTRKDICAAINSPCETLGLSHVAGMCQSHRSCSISEDTGLPLAFTVAHELGHNFGIQHDGNGNDCEPAGKWPYVMSPQLVYGTSLPRWSHCSRQYITRFLDRGWGSCLDDVPAKDKLHLSTVLPGVLYSAAHQCQLKYGSGSLLCDDMDTVCSSLWCTVGATCHSKLDGAVDGTSCGEDKWCISGSCVPTSIHPKSVNGGWATWSEWSSCSRSCGSGVQSAQRDCDNPVPKYRGRYCLGERQRYRICNTAPCTSEVSTFRDVQCSQYDGLPYKGKFYKWVAVINKVSPCELHCRPLNEHFSEKMRDAVVDGTPCFEGNKSRDMCVNGVCKSVGCDAVIESNAVEDRCGVCRGNGSTCQTVRRTFEESEGLGYVDIGLIPKGARDIWIEEVAEAGNFLALRSDNPNKYFLNGGWTIQWNGEYKAAGTVFTYERMGHLENLTSPGPTMEPLWIQLLFQETNPGVLYQYTISRNVSDDNGPISVFRWKFGSWSECSVTCGRGVQRQMVHCVEETTGIVEAQYCDPLTRPEDNRTSCNKESCPALWWVGEWQKCSSSCGSSGLAKRMVHCVQAVSLDEQKALLDSDCEHIPKPESVTPCNTHVRCPADWTVGAWSKCSLTCGPGVRHRSISCPGSIDAECEIQKKPPAVSPCHMRDCPEMVDNFGGIESSGSGWESREVLNDINSITDIKLPPKHGTTKAQTRPQGSPSNIVPSDFHYHNNIESINNFVETDVHIDDFYYDYNFIDFHEDLSDDSNGKDSGGSQEFDARLEADSAHSVRENNSETTRTPAEIPDSETAVPKASEMWNTSDENVNKNVDDFYSEDHLLPVSVTRSPPQRHAPRHRDEFPPIDVSTVHSSEHGRAQDENRTEVLGDFVVTSPTIIDIGVTTADESQLQMTYSELTTQQPSSSASVEINENRKQSAVTHLPNQSTGHLDQSDPATTVPTLIPTRTNFKSDETTRVSDVPRLRQTLFPVSEDSTLPQPLRISGNHGPSENTTGNDLLHSATQTPPATLTEHTTEPAVLERPGPGPTNSEDLHYNEMTFPAVSKGIRSPSHLTHVETKTSPEPASTVVPSPTSTPSTLHVTAHWVTGNWSVCSTSCGLGAVWRTLACSTGSEWDCDPAERPSPAQRCYLRPCSMWKVGEWSKCSKNCDVGIKSREVHCYDMRDQRPLRPFHCRAISLRPLSRMICNPQPCLDWYTSSWGQCSEVCGGGEQQRIVTCLEEGRCNTDLQPLTIQPCNSQPCAQWMTGAWGKCSAPCGGGVQHRLIKCVNSKTQTEEVDPTQCQPQLKPELTQKCNSNECKSAPSRTACPRDRLTLRFCQTLRMLGRCHMSNVRAQCCRTCHKMSNKSGEEVNSPREEEH
ncbi:A disintegrin and metalloproteinase with thrombospondin motifs 7 [Synchiropus splendidus]|uniref:A disintegrin and metalloproteinase with thrombospondin motifs 7 n=1 Tax=Synchiropus splendidus TaxID=270530 RepID=UPI00237E785E|nr:A disintegrin and metalloproteinase with thrombospondin motifs 7 [Synchiropus splendidus]